MTEQNDSWYGEFPAETADDFKSWIGEKNYADPQTALQAHFNLEKVFGADKAGRTIVMPKDDADTEGIAAFNTKLGVPDKPEGYELPVPEGESEEFSKQASAWFHAAGVPKVAAQKIAEEWNGFFGKLVTDQQAESKLTSEKALNDLRVEWADAYDKNAEFGRRGMQAYGSKAGLDAHDLNALEESIGTAKMLKLFNELGQVTAEAGFSGGDENTFTMTPLEAQNKLDEARDKRIKDEITEKQFFEIQERYGPIASKAAAAA